MAGTAGCGAGDAAGSGVWSSLCQSGARGAVGDGPPAQPAKEQTATAESIEAARRFIALSLCKCGDMIQAY